MSTEFGESIIEISTLTKKFGSFTAVDGVSFDVKKGEIFGFLGPNGAGKTTTINMLCTLLRPSGGSAHIAGYDVENHPHHVRQHIGLIFQEPSLDERLTGWENLQFHARLYNVPRTTFRERAEHLLEMVELTDKARQPVKAYSGGMKRRLEIARGLLHHPDVLFLDEPTIGLDPQTRRHIWTYLVDLRRREGTTLLMTTHYIDEAENCDRIAIIDHGKIVELDTPEYLKGEIGGDVISIATDDNERATRKLETEYQVQTRKDHGNRLVIEMAGGSAFIPKLIHSLTCEDPPIQVTDVTLRQPSLEDVFVHRTGHAIREESANQGKENMRQHMRMQRRS
jgi:ABC-2 type transport system ATP-binding protein